MDDLESTTYRRVGLVLIAIGFLSAAGSLVGFPVVRRLWPLLTLSLGIGFLGIFFRRRDRSVAYLALGEYLVLFSGLALYCNFTSWRTLGRLWPIFIAFLGVVFATALGFRRASRVLLFLALVSLLLSGALLLVFTLGSQYWWTIPILVGLSVLVAGMRR